MPQAAGITEIRAEREGHIHAMDGRALGILAMDLGAGRRDRNDILDLGVGLRVLAQVGQKVAPGDRLFEVYAKAGAAVAQEPFRATLAWSGEPVDPQPWLLAALT